MLNKSKEPVNYSFSAPTRRQQALRRNRCYEEPDEKSYWLLVEKEDKTFLQEIDYDWPVERLFEEIGRYINHKKSEFRLYAQDGFNKDSSSWKLDPNEKLSTALRYEGRCAITATVIVFPKICDICGMHFKRDIALHLHKQHDHEQEESQEAPTPTDDIALSLKNSNITAIPEAEATARSSSPKDHKILDKAEFGKSYAAQRKRIEQEFIASEESYTKGLVTVVELFVLPLQEENSKILSHKYVDRIFSNVQTLANFHKVFLEDLKNAKSIPKVFLNLCDFLKMYTKYVNEYTDCIQELDDLKHRKPAFRKFLEEKEEDLHLESLLITPVQRIPRYLLLLRELKSKTAKYHPDYETMKTAYNKIETIADHVNERKRGIENQAKMFLVQSRIAGGRSIIKPARMFVDEGDLQLVVDGKSNSRVHVFLFNDLLVWTRPEKKKLKYQGSVELKYSEFKKFDEPDEPPKSPSSDKKCRLQKLYAFEVVESSSEDEQKSAEHEKKTASSEDRRKKTKHQRMKFIFANKDERDHWFDEIVKQQKSIKQKKKEVNRILRKQKTEIGNL